MRTLSIHARFLLAGCLLVATTAGTGLWSAWTFARQGVAADRALAESQEKIDLTAALAGSLEREDDALLLALSGEAARAERELAQERQRGDDYHQRLQVALDQDGSPPSFAEQDLGRTMDLYRQAGSDLLLLLPRNRRRAEKLYHEHVNALLRQAVADCGQIREETFEGLRQAGLRSRDEAVRAAWVVAGASVAALVLAIAVSTWLARAIVGPVRQLRECVESVRQGDFARRAEPASSDELGQLAQGFNRMAETLAEYRSSSLGELLSAKRTLEATLNALPDAVLVVAPDGTLTMLNPLAREVLPMACASPDARLGDLPLRPEHREAVEEALAGRPRVPPRTDFGRALSANLDGRHCLFLLRAAPIPELAPGRCGAVMVLDDVTEFARLDELRGELIGVASHELKTPLTTVRMSLLLLGEEAAALTPRQRQLLDAALGACEELGSTIDELLDMTRIEAGQLRLNLARVDLAANLDRVLVQHRPRFEDAGVRIAVERKGEAFWVQGDAARLGTVLANLLTNALKYSPGGSTVTVSLSPGPSDGGDGLAAVQAAVTDEGPGIPAELRERVFEKFFRVEHHRGTSAGAAHGTGIGLYLCREIIKAHGGSIGCTAGPGGIGTRVTFLLPSHAPPH
jgi:NtrC-family two-component system sensor histidine kinase KinB